MAPKKKKEEPEEDEAQRELEKYCADREKWAAEKGSLTLQINELQKELLELKEAKDEKANELDKKKSEEGYMFEYLTNVVQQRDVEIADLKAEHQGVQACVISHQEQLRKKLDQIREKEKEYLKLRQGNAESADELFDLRQAKSGLSEKCKILEAELHKCTEKLDIMEKRVHDSEKLRSLMRAVTDDLQSGITPVITMSMRERSSNPLLLSEACAALEGIMLRSTDVTARATDPWWVESIDPVLQAMEQFPDHRTLQTNACDMIWKLCLQDGHFHSVILAKNGLPLILTAMKNHIGCGRLQYASCGALRRLLACAASGGAVQTPRANESGQLNAANLVMSALDNHKDQGTVLVACAAALRQLAKQGEDVKVAMIKAGCVTKCFVAMGTHQQNQDLLVAMVQFIVELFTDRPPALGRAIISEIAIQERSNEIGMGSIEGLLMDGEHRALFDDKELKDLDKIVDKAKTMISLKEDDDDDNADADVSWIHQKV